MSLLAFLAGRDPIVSPFHLYSDNKEGYVSPGGAVGIAIGCAVAGALLAVLAMILIKRRKSTAYNQYGGEHGTQVVIIQVYAWVLEVSSQSHSSSHIVSWMVQEQIGGGSTLTINTSLLSLVHAW